MFNLNRILLVVFSVAFVLAGTVSFADYNVPLDFGWSVKHPGGDVGYVPIDEVTNMEGDNFTLTDEDTPGQYTFSTSFSVEWDERFDRKNRVLSTDFVFQFFTSSGVTVNDIVTIILDGKYGENIIVKGLCLPFTGEDEGEKISNFYRVEFELPVDMFEGEHQIDFLVDFADLTKTPNTSDFGFKFGEGGVVSAATISNPEPATLLVFAIASSAAAVPAVRRFRKK